MARDADLLIRGGRVYDGTGAAAFEADIIVAGDRIRRIVRPPAAAVAPARAVIDARGLSVSPGFIDTHAHSEFTLLADGRAEGKVLQGVTTEINGNCGLSAAPLYGEAREQREADLAGLGISERWSTLSEYLRILESRCPCLNFATLAGHGNIRASVIGYAGREAGPEDLNRMKALLAETVAQGAIGLSTGLIYPPGVYSDTGELAALCRSIRGLIYTSHMRSEGERLVEAIYETLKIGRDSGIAIHISHLKTAGRGHWHKIGQAIGAIGAARAEDVRVTADRYPYIAAATDLDAVLPSWTYAGGAAEELRRLRDPEILARIRQEVLGAHPYPEYWEAITVSSVESSKNRWMEGMSIAAIAERRGSAAVDCLFELLVDEGLRVGAIFHSMTEENLKRFLMLPYMMIGSDSSARSTDGPTRRGKPHPRGFGAFPRFIGRYVREQGLMTLEEAVRRMTLLPATTFGLAERGRVKEGFFADLMVFDEERVIDRATFEEPFLLPEGIAAVIVNGRLAAHEGRLTGKAAGRVLRHGR